MITTNLSTRPFYNEGAVRFWLLLLALAIGGATIFNVSRLLYYSRSDTEQATQAARDEELASQMSASAARLRASVNPKQFEAAFGQAREANALIDRRTFSWTELFNQFETTLPDQARITSVRPRIDKDRGLVLAITVLAAGVDDVDRFMEGLIATGQFEGLLSREEHPTEDGQLQASLEAIYHPRAHDGAAPEADAASSGASAVKAATTKAGSR